MSSKRGRLVFPKPYKRREGKSDKIEIFDFFLQTRHGDDKYVSGIGYRQIGDTWASQSLTILQQRLTDNFVRGIRGLPNAIITTLLKWRP